MMPSKFGNNNARPHPGPLPRGEGERSGALGEFLNRGFNRRCLADHGGAYGCRLTVVPPRSGPSGTERGSVTRSTPENRDALNSFPRARRHTVLRVTDPRSAEDGVTTFPLAAGGRAGVRAGVSYFPNPQPATRNPQRLPAPDVSHHSTTSPLRAFRHL